MIGVKVTVRGEEWPPTLSTREAASLFGLSYDGLLDLAKAGTAPVAPLRLGSKYRWPTVQILRVLGIEQEGDHR